MKLVFLDTVGLLALWDKTDDWRPAALTAKRTLDAAGVRLVTTPQVLLECGNAAARKPYRSHVFALRDGLKRQGNLIDPTAGEIEDAWAAYQRDRIGGASIVDHISFVVMQRMNITDAFTNGRHFKAAGFNTLF